MHRAVISIFGRNKLCINRQHKTGGVYGEAMDGLYYLIEQWLLAAMAVIGRGHVPDDPARAKAQI